MHTDQSHTSRKNFSPNTAPVRRRDRAPLRATRVAMLIAVLFSSGHTLAQTAHSRLGTPEVQSSLGNPLWVRIPIEPTMPGEDVSTSRFMLGTRPVNSAFPFLESGEVGFERTGDKYFLVIRSRQPIDEPAIGLVIREQIPNGIRSREFTLLLDPPTMANVRQSERAAAPGPATESVYMAAQAVQTIAAPKPVVTVAATEAAPSQTVKATPPPAPRPRPSRSRAAGASADAAAVKTPVKSTVVPAKANTATSDNRVRPATRSTSVAGAVSNGPRLTLSLGEGLNERTTASEAERAELRMRRMMLDLDDLTASLLERQNRISQLEKELAGLAIRVAAAERVISGGTVPDSKNAGEAPALVAAQSLEQTTPAPAQAAPVGVSPTVTPAAKAPSATRTSSTWQWLLIGTAALIALGLLIRKVRAVLSQRDESYRLVPQQADDYVAEVLRRDDAATQTSPYTKTVQMMTRVKPAPAPSVAAAVPPEPAPEAPEIHFELPETPPQTHEVGPSFQPSDEAFAFDNMATTSAERTASEDLRSRRMRYLQSRYQDIAILMPPIDAPQRLLNQAGTVYDEGAAEFAKRLLKFASYSRPYAEEFWLALLELLYREKIASDYIVNARWFHQHLPASTHWNEVVRIGYLLDPADPLFALATHWSHDEPVRGIWLPSTPSEQKIASTLPHLTLELAN
jgi:hypothetical protein